MCLALPMRITAIDGDAGDHRQPRASSSGPASCSCPRPRRRLRARARRLRDQRASTRTRPQETLALLRRDRGVRREPRRRRRAPRWTQADDAAPPGRRARRRGAPASSPSWRSAARTPWRSPATACATCCPRACASSRGPAARSASRRSATSTRSSRWRACPQVTLATFGDLVRVPASRTTLAAERAAGADVRVVYSPRDAVEIAAAEPEREVVFAGIGFETTAPTVGAALLEALERGLPNFSVLSLHKTMPLPLRRCSSWARRRVRGFILPGHVSVVTGTGCYEFLARDYGVAGVVAGFEPHDVLQALLMLVRQTRAGHRDRVQARRAAGGQPRRAAAAGARLRALRRRLARPGRHPGLGPCAARGVRRRRRGAALRRRAASRRSSRPAAAAARCCAACIDPAECALFGGRCTPQDPVGACMVSSEGACAARYRYRGVDD